MKNIKTKDNFLSAYGFACGYTETRESDTISLQLYKEHNTYHVRFNRFDLPYSLRNDCKGWESFDKLKDAKDRFFALCDTFRFIKIKL
jgi:hypothetical protein